jgi:hypothetical protein
MNEATADNDLEKWSLQLLGGMAANYLWFRNTGGQDILLSLNAADAAASIGMTVASGGGTVAIPCELSAFWTISAGGASAFESIAFMRRG